jgi:cytochrome d ubiquinol oxidase subunit I
MGITPLILSRFQFAFTISLHIIFPAFTVGLAAWLACLEVLSLATGKPVYRRLFDFWLSIFGVAFGLGVVSGIVMAFEFGTNWSELSRRAGAIQGPLLSYESFSAFALEAAFFGVLVFGRQRVSRSFYLLSCILVAAGTSMSSFWIMANNSWMQWPVGFTEGLNGTFSPNDWTAIIFNSVVWVRFLHMIMAAYVTTAFCVAATGAWHLLRDSFKSDARTMIKMGLGLAAVLVPAQLLIGHFVGDYTHDKQPTKFAAIEARWHDEQPASEVLIAWPDAKHERNSYEISIPYLGSLIGSMSLHSREVGLTDFPRADRPPVLIPFLAFRAMVGCGLLMLALSWLGTYLGLVQKLEKHRWFLWATFCSFPLGFVATLMGWFTAEVGRQPWVIFGHLRTSDAITPFLTTPQVATTLGIFASVYVFIWLFGAIYIYRLLRRGPVCPPSFAGAATNPKRPLSMAGESPGVPRAIIRAEIGP